MYYIKNGLGPRFALLGSAFASVWEYGRLWLGQYRTVKFSGASVGRSIPDTLGVDRDTTDAAGWGGYSGRHTTHCCDRKRDSACSWPWPI
jgi:hypothetical protein